MNKELGVRSPIKEIRAISRIQKNATSYDVHYSVEQREEDFQLVKQTLTPPTAEDVCKVLSEYYEKYIFEYDKDEKTFRGSNEELEFDLCWRDDELIEFKNKWNLPPHLITLIGRFYEGVMSND